MKPFRRPLLLTLLIVVALAGTPRLLVGDVTISAEHKQAIRVASEYVALSSTGVDRYLQRYEFPVPTTAADWRRFPAIRKLEIAYTAAETAKQGGGGRLLALLAHDLALRRQAVRTEPALRTFLAAPPPLDDIEFSKPELHRPVTPLQSKTREAIRSIAHYTANGVDPVDILVRDIGVTPDRAYTILAAAPSHETALATAFAEVSSDHQATLEKIVTRLAERYQSVPYDSHLSQYLKRRNTEPAAATSAPEPRQEPPHDSPSFSPSPGGGGGGGGEGMPRIEPPRASRSADAAFSEFTGSSEGEVVVRSFGEMAVVAEGFGGVVLGNTIADDHLPSVKSVSFAPPGAIKGDLVVTFIDGSSSRLPDVSADEALAAKRIVFDRVGFRDKDPEDAGVGLTGLRARFEYSGCGHVTGEAFDMVIHPALVNLDLGWSAVYADLLPINRSRIMRPALQKRKSDAAFDDVQALLDALDEEDAYNWKFVDVPLSISRSNDVLFVERNAESGEFPEGLRRVAFIEMRPFITSDRVRVLDRIEGSDSEVDFAKMRNTLRQTPYNKVLADLSYTTMPSLMHLFPDYARLNSFARVLAVFRWVKHRHGVFIGDVPVPAPVRTPEALAAINGKLVPIRGATKTELAEHEMRRCTPSKPKTSKGGKASSAHQ
jgi:hypothetical protein